jgi:hypothetical protein
MSAAPVAAETIGGTIGISQDQIRDGDGRGQAGERSGGPQARIEDDGVVEADQVASGEQRARADGQQRHRRRAVKRRHRRVASVAARRLWVAQPMHRRRGDQQDQQRRCDHPGDDGQRLAAGEPHWQQHGRNGDDAGAHDRSEPVGAEIRQRLGGRSAGIDTSQISTCSFPM